MAYGLLSVAPVLPQLTVTVQNASMISGSALPTFTGAVTGLTNGDMHVHATYDGTTLTIVITDTQTGKTATQNYPINIPSTVGGNTAYVGFTAGTGGQSAVQDILTWTYGPAAPVSTILPSFADGFAPR